MNEMCLFCGICRGAVAAQVIRQDEWTVSFRDINPVAPGHVLVVPRKHVPSAAQCDDPEMWGHLMCAVVETARAVGFEERGYRLVVNCGEEACQTIPHLHVHLLSGRRFSWPPG
ncbi:histidine triad nucleotide-binding protein [Aminiphilus circumscriptus]|jgi:histidine triad (HIT) family protein|uniref:histidine triad nucleotide-binding protein n=1 Tax=Aminiphilus circumscriptus TaxID=290732 RepID=UPI0004927E45|nr:histidine triad nucleotide-binding protein [Aminiphilus circumscriptus]